MNVKVCVYNCEYHHSECITFRNGERQSIDNSFQNDSGKNQPFTEIVPPSHFVGEKLHPKGQSIY